MGTFGNPGNGDYRGDLLRAAAVITGYITSQHLPLHRAILRLDGQYGDYAVVIDLDKLGLAYVMRGKDYGLLDQPEIQARLALSPDQEVTHPETGTTRALFDCLDVSLTPVGPRIRVIVATHPAQASPARIGTTRDGVVYELFFTCLPPSAFTPADVLDLYAAPGAVLRQCFPTKTKNKTSIVGARTPPMVRSSGRLLLSGYGTYVSNWAIACIPLPCVLPSSQKSKPYPTLLPYLRTPPSLSEGNEASDSDSQSEQQHSLVVKASRQESQSSVSYGAPEWARTSRVGIFAGTDFELQSDGTLRCAANHPLYPQERRAEHDGTVRVVYAARIGDCRACPLREQCASTRQ